MKNINLFILISLCCFVALACQSRHSGANEAAVSCGYENEVYDLGIGVAMWSYDCDQNLIIYSDTLFSNKVFDFNVCNDDTNVVCPLFYKPDYGIYHFAVIQNSDKWHEVVYNGDQRGYLPIDDSMFQFVDWDVFLKDYSAGIRKIGEETIYTVEEVSGDMVLVVEEAGTTRKTIQWRDKSQLLIEVLLLE